MPSVASEVQNTFTARAQFPGHRSLGDTEARQPATPFAELLDNAAPTGNPPSAPRPARSDHADRTDRPDASKTADDRSADAATASDRAEAKDKDASDAKNAKDAKVAKNTQDAKDAAAAKDVNGTKNAMSTDAKDAAATKDINNTKDAPATDAKNTATAKDINDTKEALATGAKTTDVKSTDARDAVTAKDAATAKDGKKTNKAGADKTDADKTATTDGAAKPDTDKSAALDAIIGDAAQAVTAPQTPVAAPNEPRLLTIAVAPNDAPNAEADALAALQAAGPQTGAAKPAQIAGNAQRNAQGSAQVVGGNTQGAQGSAQGAQGARGEAPAEGAPAIDPQNMPQIEGANEGQPRAKDEADTGGFRHELANLTGKPDAGTPVQTPGDAADAMKAGSDAMQSLGAATPANATNAAAAPASALASVPAPAPVAAVPLAGLAVEIATQATAGKNHFEIRLDPPELGRIDVRLSVDHDGRVTSHLMADRADTLDLLKRDAGDLQRALQQAGLKTSDNALEFSLRQQDFSRDDTPAQNAAQLIVPDDDPAPLEALRQGYGRLLGLGGGLDIRV